MTLCKNCRHYKTLIYPKAECDLLPEGSNEVDISQSYPHTKCPLKDNRVYFKNRELTRKWIIKKVMKMD